MDSPFQQADEALNGARRRKKGERTHPQKQLTMRHAAVIVRGTAASASQYILHLGYTIH